MDKKIYQYTETSTENIQWKSDAFNGILGSLCTLFVDCAAFYEADLK